MIPSAVKREIQSDPESGTSRGVGVSITWPDGRRTTLSSETLRRSCPCAACRESAITQPPSSRLRVLQATIDESTNLQSIWAVGNYALGMRFGDKHDSGIFSFEYLRDLCENNK